MEDLPNLKTKFQNLLEQAKKDVDDYFESKTKEMPTEYLLLKAHSYVKTIAALEQCYCSIICKAAEQRLKLHDLEANDKNLKQTVKLLYNYSNLCKESKEAGEVLYGHMKKKLAASNIACKFRFNGPKPFAMNLQF